MRHYFFNPTVVLVCCLVLLAAGCRKDKGVGTSQPSRAIYHWKTTYNPTPWEQEFLKEHKIGRIYLHLFDVDVVQEGVAPVATLRLMQPLPEDIEVVPTVFVSHGALDAISDDYRLSTYDIAHNIYDRVCAMMRCHGLEFSEVQIDCDGGQKSAWTTMDLVYFLCQRAHEDSVKVSTTLRLSLLTKKKNIPTCDQYVLMMYNTGRLQSRETHNSILDYKDVEPYIGHMTRGWLDTLAKEGRQIDIAYPLYGWGVAFHPSGTFSHLVPPDQLPEVAGDTLRVEWAQVSDIQRVQKALEGRVLPRHKRSTVLFHLDSANLARYSFEEVESIFNQ